MKCFIFFNIIHTRETLKHFPLKMSLRVQLKATAWPVSREKPNKQLKHRAVTQLTWICCSFLLTCAFSSVSSHRQHMTRRTAAAPNLIAEAQNDKGETKRAAVAQTPPDARCPTLGSACVTVRAWMAAHRVSLQTGKNSRKTHAAAAAASAAAGWEGSPHLSHCQPRLGPVTIL